MIHSIVGVGVGVGVGARLPAGISLVGDGELETQLLLLQSTITNE